MPLDPSIRKRLDAVAALGLPPVEQQTPRQIRSGLDRFVAQQPPAFQNNSLAIDNCELALEDRRIPIRIYRPEASAPLPAVVYFHGGGWVNGTLDSHDKFCRLLAAEGQAVVVSVAYRRAPEHPFPAAPDDCLAATEWVFAQTAELRVDASRVFVAGDSAGGNLAAVVSLMCRDETRRDGMRRDGARQPAIAGQILLWPVLAYYDPPTSSYLEFAEGYGLTRPGMSYFWDLYLPDRAQASNPYAAPGIAPDLRNLPPALVITAEYDVLRDEGNAYAHRLETANVPVTHHCVLGVNHGFAAWPDADLDLPQAVQVRHTIAGWIEAIRP